MRKPAVSILAAALLLLCSLFSAMAGEGKGYSFIAKGGFNYSGVSGLGDVENLNLGEYSGFNIGGGIQVALPLGFSLQPEVLYYQAGTKVNVSVDGISTDGTLCNNNIYIPVNLQWGPKMGIFRLYAQVSPFLGFAVSNRLKYNNPVTGTKTIEVLTDDTNIFMGGIGAGLGVEVWKIQVSAKYNWNLNKLFKDVDEYVKLQDAKMRGLEISVGFIF